MRQNKENLMENDFDGRTCISCLHPGRCHCSADFPREENGGIREIDASKEFHLSSMTLTCIKTMTYSFKIVSGLVIHVRYIASACRSHNKREIDSCINLILNAHNNYLFVCKFCVFKLAYLDE